MKQTLVKCGIAASLFLGGYTGAIVLKNIYADEASSGALTALICLWAGLVVVAVLAIYADIVKSRAQRQAARAERRANDAEAVLAVYEALDDFIIRIYMVCFSAESGVGHYFTWKDEFLAVNLGHDNVLKCLRDGLVPPVPDASALDDEQLAILTQMAERSHFVREALRPSV